jgi:hypothetical protein
MAHNWRSKMARQGMADVYELDRTCDYRGGVRARFLVCVRRFPVVADFPPPPLLRSRFASLTNVNVKRPKKEDSMESFVLAETLKYYYLLVRRSSPNPPLLTLANPLSSPLSSPPATSSRSTHSSSTRKRTPSSSPKALPPLLPLFGLDPTRPPPPRRSTRSFQLSDKVPGSRNGHG